MARASNISHMCFFEQLHFLYFLELIDILTIKANNDQIVISS